MSPKSNNKPAVLLLVEPDPESARALMAKLARDGHRVVHTASEHEALEIAAEETPTVILFAPGHHAEDRLSLIGRIRSVDSLTATPLLVLSHDLSDAELLKAMDRGASDFILRPFHIAELRARVRSAIRTSGMIRLLEQRARIDPLTGLWNRLYFTERLDASIATALRTNDPLAVVIIDIDHFKDINDTHGHAVGDAVLQDFAAVLRKSVRAGDTACRYGGEEFAVILPQAQDSDAVAFYQRMRSMLRAAQWPDPIAAPITASFGITTVGLGGDRHIQAWVEAADKALYAAKQGGRDCVRLYVPETGECVPMMRRAG
jgi:two-component system cell cycle response regulator